MSNDRPACRVSVPCKTCPWRTDQDATTIPHYDHGKAVGLLNTVGPDDGFRPIMSCHGSSDRRPVACRGYLAREGWRNLNVRIMLIGGRVPNPDSVLYACETMGVDLEPDYPTVLAKLARSVGRETENPPTEK